MTIWVILIGNNGQLSNAETPHKVITAKEYLSHPQLFGGQRPKLINLATSYCYQTRGYYASLLAEARGHRVVPSVETIVDLSEKQLYAHTLPELEDLLNKALGPPASPEEVPKKLRIYFGLHPDRKLDRFAKVFFDWFRAPALELTLEVVGQWIAIAKIRLLSFVKLAGEERGRFLEALASYTQREWREAKQKLPSKYSIAVLCDRHEAMPPTSISSLRYWARLAEKMGVEIEPVGKKDLSRLANFDALFIRETTSISNHTYRFARRAMQEGMPVIDDPISMIRCTNKVYLHELLTSRGLPMPPSRMISSLAELPRAVDELSFPVVVKIPDGSFSKGVRKASNMAELQELVSLWLKDTELLILQKYLPTAFDWRVAILDGKPLFVSRYLMAKDHWQILHHDERGRTRVGGYQPISLSDAPEEIIAMATAAAGCIGAGLYGVDLKQLLDGTVVIIEVNDNPDIEHTVEDASEKDQVWVDLTNWFIRRIDQRDQFPVASTINWKNDRESSMKKAKVRS